MAGIEGTRSRLFACAPVPRSRYKRLVKASFRPDPGSSEPNCASVEQLTAFAQSNTVLLPKICLFVERRAGKKHALGELRQVFVAARILGKIIDACPNEIRLFGDSAVRLVRFILRQEGADSLRMAGCELLIKYAGNSGDEASSALASFLNDLARLCHDEAPPDLHSARREIALRTIVTIVQAIGASGLTAAHFEDILPVVLLNMAPASNSRGNYDLARQMQQKSSGCATPSLACEPALHIFGIICRALCPSNASLILRPFFGYFDDNNYWANDGEAQFVLDSLLLMLEQAPAKHTYLVFMHLQTRMEGCSRPGADASMACWCIRAVTMLSERCGDIPAPAVFDMFIAVLDVELSSLESLHAADYDRHDDSARQQDKRVTRQMVEECLHCMGVMSQRLCFHANHLEALNQIAIRASQVAQIPGCEHGVSTTVSVVQRPAGREMILRTLKAVLQQGVRVIAPELLPPALLALLCSFAMSSVGAPRVHQLVAHVLGVLLCGAPRNDRDAAQRKWHERFQKEELNKLSRAVLEMVTVQGNTAETILHVHRLLVSLARNAPGVWMETFVPQLLELQNKALRDAAAETKNAADGAKNVLTAGFESEERRPELDVGFMAPPVIILGQTASQQLLARPAMPEHVREWIHTVVAGSVLAAAVAIECASLERYVREVLDARRCAGHECHHLQISDDGDLNLVCKEMTSNSISHGSAAGDLVAVLDAASIIRALRLPFPHLAHVLKSCSISTEGIDAVCDYQPGHSNEHIEGINLAPSRSRRYNDLVHDSIKAKETLADEAREKAKVFLRADIFGEVQAMAQRVEKGDGVSTYLESNTGQLLAESEAARNELEAMCRISAQQLRDTRSPVRAVTAQSMTSQADDHNTTKVESFSCECHVAFVREQNVAPGPSTAKMHGNTKQGGGSRSKTRRKSTPPTNHFGRTDQSNVNLQLSPPKMLNPQSSHREPLDETAAHCQQNGWNGVRDTHSSGSSRSCYTHDDRGHRISPRSTSSQISTTPRKRTQSLVQSSPRWIAYPQALPDSITPKVKFARARAPSGVWR